jgi:hypothetical protein
MQIFRAVSGDREIATEHFLRQVPGVWADIAPYADRKVAAVIVARRRQRGTTAWSGWPSFPP